MMPALSPALKQTLLYGMGLFLMRGVSLLMLPVMTYYLTPAEYGELELLVSVMALASIVLGYGWAETLFRFARDPKQENSVAASLLGWAVLLSAFVLVIGVWLVPLLQAVLPWGFSAELLFMLWAALAFEAVINVPLAWLRLRDEAGLFFVMTTGRALTQALLTYLLLQDGAGVEGVLMAGLVSTLIQAVFLVLIQATKTGMCLEAQYLGQLRFYALPLILSGLLVFGLNGAERWWLAAYSGAEVLAAYAVAAKLAMAVPLLVQPYGLWWHARRFRVLEQDNGRQQSARYTEIGVYLYLGIAVVVGVIAPLIIHFLLPESYAMAAQLVPWLVGIAVLKGMGEWMNLGCYAQDHAHWPLRINAVAAALGLALMSWWVPELGLMGVIWALIWAQSLRLLLFVGISQHLLTLPYAYGRVAVALLLCGAGLMMVATQSFALLGLMVLLVLGISGWYWMDGRHDLRPT